MSKTSNDLVNERYDAIEKIEKELELKLSDKKYKMYELLKEMPQNINHYGTTAMFQLALNNWNERRLQLLKEIEG